LVRRCTRGRGIVVLLLALALACRIGVVAATPNYHVPPPGFDPPAYDLHAVSIARTGVFPEMHKQPSALYPPGYPYFLGGLYAATTTKAPGRWTAARIAQALLGTLAVALVGLIAWRLWDRRRALTTMGIAAVFPPLILVGETLITESLFVPLVLAALAAVVEHRRSIRRYRWALLAGLLVGLAALTRSNAVLLLVPFALATSGRPFRRLREVAPALALIATCALTIAPWTVRNAVELHAFVPITTQASGLSGIYNDTTRRTHIHRAAFRPPQEDPANAALLARSSRLGEVALTRRLVSSARQYMLDHPLYVLEVGGLNSLRLLHLYDPGYARATARDIGVPLLLVDLGRWSFYPVGLLALLGACTMTARATPRWFWLIPVLLMTVTFVGGFIRYRAPMDPFIVMLAALALVAARDRLSHARPGAPSG
jgi:4-amino-4-deoxy-L-arabinose transferase-like glycosyltransferase